jgi:CRP-like cAMP-binding protein
VEELELLGEGSSFQDQLFDMVADATMFSQFSGAEIRQLVKYMHAYMAPAGAFIFREGAACSGMGLLVSGSIEVSKEDSSGVTKAIATILPGRTFGEMSVLDGLPYSATARAKKDCVVAILTRHNFRTLVDSHAGMGVKLLWELARLTSLRLRQTSGQLVDVLGQ